VIIRGGTIVTSMHEQRCDIAVNGDGVITALDENLDEERDEIDATGLHVFAGGIDSHVHFNEPGHSDWETIANGSAALAAGGYTSFIDMPLNSLPVTTTVEAFEAKVEAMKRSSVVDFGLWGGLVPGNLRELKGMHQRGAIGFKAFMCPSGLEEFPACDKQTLREGMKRLVEVQSILLVHAEDPDLLQIPAGPTAMDFIRSRPPEAEISAIHTAIDLAIETGCSLHIVHVSTAAGLNLIREAIEQDVDVTGETCPHYLLFEAADMERMGGVAKCAPPFRTAADRAALRRASMIVSDHSPSTLSLKEGEDFSKLWGGISGCQTTRQLLLAYLSPSDVDRSTTYSIARRFLLWTKAGMGVGHDADFWIVDLSHQDVVRREDLLYKNQFSAFEGLRIRGRTVRTLVRGRDPAPGVGRQLIAGA
jgi:allantoinase